MLHDVGRIEAMEREAAGVEIVIISETAAFLPADCLGGDFAPVLEAGP